MWEIFILDFDIVVLLFGIGWCGFSAAAQWPAIAANHFGGILGISNYIQGIPHH